MKKIMTFLLALCLLAGCLSAASADSLYQAQAPEAFGALLSALVTAYEEPAEDSWTGITELLEKIESSSAEDYELASAIADHWKDVYLDPDYMLFLWDDGAETPDLGIPDDASHAFVVLGFELSDGEMTNELRGRCETAAAAAQAYPRSILVCSGGATGSNNPDQHTEAGLMKDYLINECGLDADRIFTDERAMTTAENAVNTMVILQEQGIQTFTVVTSRYHQRWGQVLYNAVAAIYGQRYGYHVRISGNYCFDIDTDVSAFKTDDRIAIRQLSGILGIPSDMVDIKHEGKGQDDAD